MHLRSEDCGYMWVTGVPHGKLLSYMIITHDYQSAQMSRDSWCHRLSDLDSVYSHSVITVLSVLIEYPCLLVKKAAVITLMISDELP